MGGHVQGSVAHSADLELSLAQDSSSAVSERSLGCMCAHGAGVFVLALVREYERGYVCLCDWALRLLDWGVGSWQGR